MNLRVCSIRKTMFTHSFTSLSLSPLSPTGCLLVQLNQPDFAAISSTNTFLLSRSPPASSLPAPTPEFSKNSSSHPPRPQPFFSTHHYHQLSRLSQTAILPERAIMGYNHQRHFTFLIFTVDMSIKFFTNF